MRETGKHRRPGRDEPALLPVATHTVFPNVKMLKVLSLSVAGTSGAPGILY